MRRKRKRRRRCKDSRSTLLFSRFSGQVVQLRLKHPYSILWKGHDSRINHWSRGQKCRLWRGLRLYPSIKTFKKDSGLGWRQCSSHVQSVRPHQLHKNDRNPPLLPYLLPLDHNWNKIRLLMLSQNDDATAGVEFELVPASSDDDSLKYTTLSYIPGK